MRFLPVIATYCNRYVVFLIYLLFPTMVFSEHLEVENTLLTPEKTEISDHALSSFKRLNQIKELCYNDVNAALKEVRKWTDNNDFDTCTFALKIINQYYNELPFDSINSMNINYENADLLVNIGDLQGAGLYMSKAIASAILAEDSVKAAEYFITVAELNLRNFDFRRAQENLMYAASYSPLIVTSAEYQLLQTILATQKGELEKGLNHLLSIDPNEFSSPRLYALYSLYGRYLAIETQQLKIDSTFNLLLTGPETEYVLIIANTKNSYINSMLATQRFNGPEAQRIILGSPAYIKEYTQAKATNGEYMYLTAKFWRTKRRQAAYLFASIFFLVLVILISIYLQVHSKKTGKKNYMGFLNHQLETIYDLAGHEENFGQLQIRLKELKQSINTLQTHENQYQLVSDKLMSKLKTYEGVNQNDLKLISLILMQLDIREMADALHITPDAVRKRKRRLKSKLGMEHDLELYVFLRVHS